jgi:hypothetical protein
MTREIPLSQGYVALVDDEDYEAVTAAGRWCVELGSSVPYAARSYTRTDRPRRPDGRLSNSVIRMHAFLTGWSLTDHINGNGLDNRRSNLRPASPTGNSFNQRTRRDNTSGYKGVSWVAKRGTWRAYIQVEGRMLHLGAFVDPADAARAYDEAARKFAGEFACVNFPEPHERGARS